jgi:AraC family transcriptional regulator
VSKRAKSRECSREGRPLDDRTQLEEVLVSHVLSAGQFFGRTVIRRRIADLVLTEACYAPGARIPTHVHELPFACFVVDGRCVERTAARVDACGPSTLLFHPAGEAHSDDWSAIGGRCYTVEFGPSWIARASAHSMSLDASMQRPSGESVWLAARMHREFRRMDAGAELVIEGLALELTADLARRGAQRPERRRPRWVDEVRDRVHARWNEVVSLASLADAAGVHPSHLAREFRHQFRCSIGEYARRLRVERACAALARTDAPLAEIALACGFSDQSHFTRTFKRVTGATPALYRRLRGECASRSTT